MVDHPADAIDPALTIADNAALAMCSMPLSLPSRFIHRIDLVRFGRLPLESACHG